MIRQRLSFGISLVTWWLAMEALVLVSALIIKLDWFADQVLIAALLAALLYLMVQFVELSRRVRLTALLAYACLVGYLISILVEGVWEQSGIFASTLTVAISILGLVFAGEKEAIARCGRWWLLATWLYIFGWLYLWLSETQGFWWKSWAGAGLVLFTGTLIIWASAIQQEREPPDVPQAVSQLFMITLNLFVLQLVIFSH